MRELSAGGRAREWLRRHERLLIVLWLTGALAVLAFLAVWGVWFGGAERAVQAWNSRWLEKLESGERLFAERRYAEAAAHLERLDADFPAVQVKHRLDKQRERLLELLGSSYLELDRRRDALAIFERLVAFDPRNYKNHSALAEAALHFGETDRAALALESVLAIHPTHLPSVEALAQISFDGGRFEPVIAVFRRYLDAYLLARMTLTFGDRAVVLEVPVDGRSHRVEAPVELAGGWNGETCLTTGGYSVRIGALELTAPLRVGVASPAEVLRLDGGAGWEAREGATAVGESFTAQGPRATACRALGAPPSGAARLAIEITAYKALTPSLWKMVEKSHHNRLELEALAEARERSLIGGCPEAGTTFEE